MKNWLGQEIEKGSIVYRGARDGNTSSFKVGIVKYVNKASNTARVAWQFEQGHGRPWGYPSEGSPSINSLVVIDNSILSHLELQLKISEEAKRLGVPNSDYNRFAEEYAQNWAGRSNDG